MSDEPDNALEDELRQALALQRAGRLDQAIARYRAILAIDPEHPSAWTNLAVALRAGRLSIAALACCRRAVELRPDDPATLGNLGNVLKDVGRFAEAVEAHRRVIELQPANARHHYNLALSLRGAGRFDESLSEMDTSLRLEPELAQVRVDRALALLERGDWEQAWDDYESRFELQALAWDPDGTERWDGAPFEGRVLLVHHEQGHGDALWAARFLPEARRRGGRIWLQCKPALRRLFHGLDGVDRLLGPDETPQGVDLHCGLMSLPGLLGTRPNVIPGPASFPSLPDVSDAQAALLARSGNRFRVGIFWSGSVTFKGNAFRAAHLRPFLELTRHPGVQLYSLQTGPPRAQINRLGCDPVVIDAADVLGDFAQTAAFVRELDLVIMTDSALAHLMGSLGRPVWVLLGSQPFWIFGTEGETMRWYPSMRLFRSGAPQEWTALLETVGKDLVEAVAAHEAGTWIPRRVSRRDGA
jgi:Flp pilus assembly protein TadD